MDWTENEPHLKDALDALYASESYKKGCYPILNPDILVDPFIGFTFYDDENVPKRRNLADEQMKEFLEAFRKNLLNTSLEDTATERVMGSLCLNVDDELYGRNGEYPIYESYTETIRLLNSYGITSCQSDDYCVFQNVPWQVINEACQEMEADGELTVRVYEQANFTQLSALSA